MTMHTSVRSTALEPRRGTGGAGRVLTVYGLVVITLVLVAVFTVLLPGRFPTLLNFQLLTSGNAVLLVLAFGVTVPMVAGKIDLSIKALQDPAPPRPRRGADPDFEARLKKFMRQSEERQVDFKRSVEHKRK